MTDTELAAALAQRAGEMLLALRGQGKLTGKALGAEGDRIANNFLIESLTAQRPDDGLLSEETQDTPERLAKSRVWIIDPLDGTREYSEGRDDWAVHVALSIEGEAVIGAVALPAAGLVLRSDQIDMLPPVGDPLRIVVSRTRPPEVAQTLAKTLGAILVPMGSAGAKAMAVVRGTADLYVHAGGQSEWDSAAPVAVATAYGLHCSRIDGTPLIYNRSETSLPDLLVCRKDQAADVLERIAAALRR